MARRTTPRPTFDRPTALRQASLVHHLWGDEIAGFVGDEVLVSSDKIHGLIFTLPPGGRFGHSEQNRTIFGADEVYYVLEGTLLLANPATGELRRAVAGDGIFFRRDTWHHGINGGPGVLRVLETFAPPPAAGMASAYAVQQPYLEHSLYADDQVLGHWPMDRDKLEAAATLHLVRRSDQALRLDGQMLAGVLASTDQLTVTDNELLPGQASSLRSHAGDAFLLTTAGAVNVHTPHEAESNWWRIGKGDAFVIPQGSTYRCVNQGAKPARFVLAAAPTYAPTPEP